MDKGEFTRRFTSSIELTEREKSICETAISSAWDYAINKINDDVEYKLKLAYVHGQHRRMDACFEQVKSIVMYNDLFDVEG
jgi:hypothetical protein